MYSLIAIAAGVSIVVARIINSNLADKIGIFEGTFLNYVIGLLFSMLFLFVSSETFTFSTGTLTNLPFWAYLGGLVGIIVVAASNLVTPKISAFYLTLIIFIGQLFAGILIDYHTLNIISKGKILGGLIVIIGLTYNLIVDKKQLNAAKTTTI